MDAEKLIGVTTIGSVVRAGQNGARNKALARLQLAL